MNTEDILETQASEEWIETICEAAFERLMEGKYESPLDPNQFGCAIAELYVDTHPQDLEDWFFEHDGTQFMENCEQYMIESMGPEANSASRQERLHMLQFFAIARIAKTLVNNLSSENGLSN
jgi:hypothetical protein